MGLCSTKVDKIFPDASQFWSCVVCGKHAEWEAHYMVRCTCPMRIHFPFSHSFTVTPLPTALPTTMYASGTRSSSHRSTYTLKEQKGRPRHPTPSPLQFCLVIMVDAYRILVRNFVRRGLATSSHRLTKRRMIVIDPTCRYMITTSGNRGWDGVSTNACLFYDIASIV